jgi:hypothetical protein
VTIGVMGRGLRDPADWSALEDDPRTLPLAYVRARYGRDEDVALDSSSIASAIADRPVPPFDVAGCDMAPAVRELVKTYVGPWLDQPRRMSVAAGRFLDALRPRALLIDREGTRLPWIAAAQRHGIPVVTVQHGMIYPGNPEYFRPRIPGRVQPDLTCVFGDYERELLVGEAGYTPGEVVVTGSPRVAGGESARVDADTRRQVRNELGVAAGNRILVISAAHNPIGELLTAGMLAAVLDGPLPGVHLVVKLHPQDSTPGDYASFFAGLAAAGGYAAPPVSVVRDIDLLRLLGAADAHLGSSSTVLTDAVAAGLPNMVALGQAQADPLGYVAAGVAAAVRSVDDVRAFMADPRPPDPVASRAFLDTHFQPGDAAGRLADVVVGAPTGAARSTAQEGDA